MKRTLLLALALSLTLSIHTMQHDKKAIIEQLNLISSHIEQNKQFHDGSINKLEALIETYDSLSAQVDNDHALTQLAHIKENLIECKEMLDEDRQNTRFWFFNPAWDSEDDDAREEIDENAFFQQINADLAEISGMLKGDMLNVDRHSDDQDSDYETVSISSEQINDDFKETLLTYVVQKKQ